MIGDYLYELTPRDQVSVRLEPHFESFVTTGLLASLDAEHEVEKGYCYLLDSVLIKAIPGGAQNVNALACYVLPPGKNTQLVLFEAASANAALSLGLVPNLVSVAGAPIVCDRQFNKLLIPEGWTIRSHGFFSAGAVSNAVALELFATRIPRGNVAV